MIYVRYASIMVYTVGEAVGDEPGLHYLGFIADLAQRAIRLTRAAQLGVRIVYFGLGGMRVI